jgi:hypothetical protein
MIKVYTVKESRWKRDRVYLCSSCHWEKVPFRRWQKGLTIKDPEERKKYFTCLACGEETSPSREALHRADA